MTLTDADGVSGHGEAAPLQPYDGVSIARVRAALEAYRPVLMQSATANGAQLIEACRRVEDLPAALAAIDLALWDRAGRRAGKPVAALLTDDPAAEIQVNATVGATDRAGAAEQAARAAEQGFECVKLKVGVGDDAGRVAAVRAAVGPHTALRVDANGAWDVEEAVRAIEALDPGGPGAGGGAHATACRRCARCASAWPRAWRSTRPRPSTARSARASPTRCA